MQPRSYLSGKETILKPEGAVIPEPTGLGGGKFSLLETTQIVLKAAEGASCLALEEPAQHRPSTCFTPGQWFSFPRGCVVVREILGKAELCCIIEVYRPVQAVPPPRQWAAPKCFPGTRKNTRLVAKLTEREIKTFSLPPTPLHLCKHFIFSYELQKHFGSNQWGNLYTELNFSDKTSNNTTVPVPPTAPVSPLVFTHLQFHWRNFHFHFLPMWWDGVKQRRRQLILSHAFSNLNLSFSR